MESIVVKCILNFYMLFPWTLVYVAIELILTTDLL